MTIEVDGTEIWVRCSSGDHTMLCIAEGDGENIIIEAGAEPGSILDSFMEENGHRLTIALPKAELVGLAMMILFIHAPGK
jgi:hypothetical protein